MSETATRPPPPTGTDRLRRLRVTTSALRRLQQTRARLALAIAVGGVLLLTALATNVGDGGRDAVRIVITEAAFGIAVPITTLVFAIASLGDLAEDGTLVYVWLRPIPRPHVALAATIATSELTVPLTLLMAAGVAIVGGEPGLLVGALVATFLGALAYTSLFVALGLRTGRSLLWGLGYLLLIEGFLARFSDQIAAISIRRHATAVFAHVTGIGRSSADPSLGWSIGALVVFVAVGVALTARWLRNRDVD